MTHVGADCWGGVPTFTGGHHWRIQGGAKDTCPPLAGPNSFIFMQLSATNLQNNRLAHPLWELAPPTPRKILDTTPQ